MNSAKLEEVVSGLVSTVAIDYAVITSRDGLPILSKKHCLRPDNI